MKKNITEIIEPLKPKNVRHTKPIHNKGTNTARQLEKFTYYTNNNNKVEIICEPTGYDRYKISFAVNGEVKSNKNFFDRDVLKTVFTLLPKIAKKLNMEEIFIESFIDENDEKHLKNIKENGVTLQLKNKIKETILQYQDAMGNLRDGSDEHYSYKTEISRLKYFLNFLDGEENYKWEFRLHDTLSFYKRNKDLDELYKKYKNYILSQSDEGAKIIRNRRHTIYQNLLPKFMPDWKIEDHSYKGYDAFTLTKKNLILFGILNKFNYLCTVIT